MFYCIYDINNTDERCNRENIFMGRENRDKEMVKEIERGLYQV
jgi:hypothetical protein